jgi:hypothetical protein
MLNLGGRDWVVAIAEWRAAGTPLSLLINITGADLRRPEFPGEVADRAVGGRSWAWPRCAGRSPGELKLDQQLLSGMDDDPGSATTVRAGIALAHALGAVVVAEGVESATMSHRPAELRVDAVQGHLLGRPQTAASLIGWLAGRRHSGAVPRPGGDRDDAAATETAVG